MKCGYEVTFNNRSHASSKWVGEGPEPKRGIISYTHFRQYWNENHSNLVVSLPTKDICSLCHALANQHHYNLSHDLLFCKETDEVRDNEEARDSIAGDPDNSLVCDPPGWDSDDENLSPPNAQNKQPPQSHVHVPAGISEVETREQMLLQAAWHVKSACCQRCLYQSLVDKARSHSKDNIPHSEQSYTFVVDYGQNMEMPCFGSNQPGDTYYFTPLSVYNLGIVNCVYVHLGETVPKDHMYCHVYHEGIAAKGANNVASLILKTLTDSNIIRDNEKGGELNIVFDNCAGQNKNNTVLRLIPYLVELGYFKKVNFVFWLLVIPKILLICYSMF